MTISREYFRQPRKYWMARAVNAADPVVATARRLLVRSHQPGAWRWRRLALVGADHIGDILCRTSALEQLKAGTGAELHFICSRPAAELLEAHPAVSSVVIAHHANEHRTMRERVELLSETRCDAVLCYDTGDYWRDQVAATLARVPAVIGYSHKGFRSLVTKSLTFRFPVPFASQFSSAVAELTGGSASAESRPVVPVTTQDEERASAAAQLARRSGDGPLLAIGITGNQPHGEALKERFMETLVLQRQRRAFVPVFLGAAKDEPELRERAERWNLSAAFLCGTLTLRECVAFLRLTAGAFVVDSGVRHLANAAGIPVAFFRNLYTFEGETGPYLSSEIDLAPPGVECLSRERLKSAPPLFSPAHGAEVLGKLLGEDAATV